jgi:hypothetical protein
MVDIETMAYPDQLDIGNSQHILNVLKEDTLSDVMVIIADALHDTHKSFDHEEYLKSKKREITKEYDRKIDIDFIHRIILNATEILRDIYIEGSGYINMLLKEQAEKHINKNKEVYYNIASYVEDLWEIINYVDEHYVKFINELVAVKQFVIIIELLKSNYIYCVVIK